MFENPLKIVAKVFAKMSHLKYTRLADDDTDNLAGTEIDEKTPIPKLCGNALNFVSTFKNTLLASMAPFLERKRGDPIDCFKKLENITHISPPTVHRR